MDQETLQICRLTQDAYYALRSVAEETPKLYLDADTNFHEVLISKGITDYAEDTGIVFNLPITLTPTDEGPQNLADIRALDFYNSLAGLTPSAATDGLMWTWMTHFVLHSYSLGRWRSWRVSDSNLANHIKSHWFAVDSGNAIRRHNTASRTWWVAHTAIKAAQASGGAFTAENAIEHFANSPRHYHNIMDSNFSRNPLIRAEMLRALLNEAQGISGRGSDQIWKRMNLTAGTLLLDALSREQVREHIINHVEEIMSIPEYVVDRTKLRNLDPTVVLSLGAGVQSSCLALMAERGEHGLPKPDFAIFADTGWEPPEVYEHLDWLRSQLSYDIIVVNSGNIKENILDGKMPDGSTFLGIPAFLVNPDGSTGILHRQCTTHYKTNPIYAYLRDKLEIQPRRRAPRDVQVEMWLGISVDESGRQKPGREEWITKRYPLIDLGYTRGHLLNWFNENYPGRYLPTSSCIGCPYHSDAVWKQLKENDPKSFEDAVFVDKALRTVPATRGTIKGEAYLHRSRVPLSEVDFSEVTSYDDQMMEECEGLCGI